MLDREVSSGPSGDGKFLIHYWKHPAQKQQGADLGKHDIGAQGAGALGSTKPSSRNREASLAAQFSPAGLDPSIYSYVFTRQERGLMEIHHHATNARPAR